MDHRTLAHRTITLWRLSVNHHIWCATPSECSAQTIEGWCDHHTLEYHHTLESYMFIYCISTRFFQSVEKESVEFRQFGFFIHPHSKTWAYAVPLSSVHVSISPFHFVFGIASKPFGGFLWNLVQRKITLCRCAYCKRNPIQLFNKELLPLDLAFSMKNCKSSLTLLGILMKLGTKITLCRCANCKGSPVQFFFKELWSLDLAYLLLNSSWTLLGI
jgi:hypothetical protein